MRIDVNAFLGAYPFRRVPGTSPDAVLAAMDRASIDEAWVAHLPSVFWRDPAAGNSWLYDTVSRHPRLRAVPAVHPGLPGWEQYLQEARDRQAAAVRCDPTFYGLEPGGPEMETLAAACAAAGMALATAVRLEDARQRHPRDVTPELPAAAVRTLLRAVPDLRLVVTHAHRAFIEEVHFGSTAGEAARVWWDLCWLWGPLEDDLAMLLETVGTDRFVFGTGQPLRIPEASVAKLDLLDLMPEWRTALESGNARALEG